MSSETPFSPAEWRTAAEGLSAIAITSFEMGSDSDRAREAVLVMWEQLGRPRDLFKAAAETVSHSPQPMPETAGETERTRYIREMLGVTSAEDALISMLSARELLEKLAAEFDG